MDSYYCPRGLAGKVFSDFRFKCQDSKMFTYKGKNMWRLQQLIGRKVKNASKIRGKQEPGHGEDFSS